MLYFKRTRFLRFVILPLALVALLPACYKWSTMHGPHDQAVASRPDHVRVTVTDGSQLQMRHPWIQGDSIIGLGTQKDTLAVRFSDVSKLEKRKFDWLAVGGVYVLVSAVYYVIVCGDDELTC